MPRPASCDEQGQCQVALTDFGDCVHLTWNVPVSGDAEGS